MKGLSLLLVLFLLLWSGCAAPGGQSAPPDPSEAPSASVRAAPSGGDGSLTYSNLDSDTARWEVGEALAAAGVPQGEIDTFFTWVTDYNGCMGSALSLAGEFTTVEGTTVDYGDYPVMSRQWYKAGGRDYRDVLCRIAAWQLSRHRVAVERVISREQYDCWDPEASWLYSDGDILFGREAVEGEHKAYRPYPLLSWDEEEIGRYFTLFAPIASEGEPEMLRAVQDAWRERGVSFGDGACSLVTLWTRSGGTICVAHAAVLLEVEGGYLLVEKTNPESPYAATRFSSTQGVRDYLLDMMALDYARYGLEMGECLVLRDGEVL